MHVIPVHAWELGSQWCHFSFKSYYSLCRVDTSRGASVSQCQSDQPPIENPASELRYLFSVMLTCCNFHYPPTHDHASGESCLFDLHVGVGGNNPANVFPCPIDNAIGKWQLQDQRGRTHTLGNENGVRSGFNCEKGEGRTDWETKME